MAIYQVPESERAVREQLRKQLAWHGFGQLSPSTWLSPHDLISEVREIAAEYPLAKVDALWCGTGDLAGGQGPCRAMLGSGAARRGLSAVHPHLCRP